MDGLESAEEQQWLRTAQVVLTIGAPMPMGIKYKLPATEGRGTEPGDG